MKKVFLILITALLFNSCSKDSNSTSSPVLALSDTPSAKSEFDGNNYGIYKGVFVGSSGNVLINIKNDGSFSAKLIIDGITYNFTTTENATSNQAISGLTFTNGSSSFDFNVDASGSNPIISNIVISGHPNATISVFKELSNLLVKCYEGTYLGQDTGVLNVITYNGMLKGLAKPTGSTNSIELNGTVINNSISGQFSGGTFVGTVNSNTTISGTWQNSEPQNGTWSGIRKL
ncbi:hypothetical protein [Flavobacterium psychrotolerans]|uniref:Uncharacterized protein n=1 Tax=Flavobacterium psychrotolerans TaxID=2169410 RepID=A0A2U1JNL4_9FLAO|nr:hypothetical protein [Flavobacterium psychrotolerans]PWA06483.1 hypothetical protein DB895_03425 [Flavobacterium psychrotolerans]